MANKYVFTAGNVTLQVAKRCFVPALFGHATEDDFILPHHSDKIYESYMVTFHLSCQCIDLLSAKLVMVVSNSAGRQKHHKI